MIVLSGQLTRTPNEIRQQLGMARFSSRMPMQASAVLEQVILGDGLDRSWGDKTLREKGREFID